MNAKVKVYISMTLDGFIASKGGNIDYLDPYANNPEVGNHYDKFVSQISDIVFGKTTYLQVKDDIAAAYDDKNVFVFTHENLQDENVTFLNENLVEHINSIKEKAEKDIWVVGGAKLINQLLEEDLVDEMVITFVPLMLGTGIKLFKKKSKTAWRLTKTKKIKDLIYVTYQK